MKTKLNFFLETLKVGVLLKIEDSAEGGRVGGNIKLQSLSKKISFSPFV